VLESFRCLTPTRIILRILHERKGPSASDIMRRVASDRSKDLLERYWVGLDPEKLRGDTKSSTDENTVTV